LGGATSYGVYGLGGTYGVYGSTSGATSFGEYGYNGNTSGTGILGIGNGTSGKYLTAGSGVAGTGTAAGVYGYATGSGGYGVYGADSNATGGGYGVYGFGQYGGTSNPSYTYGGYFYANGGTQDCRAVYGYAYGSSLYRYGGYFSNNGGGYAYVGAWNNGTAYKIYGSGTVSEIIPTEGHGRVTLVCPESPEYWYQDFGTAALVNGKAHVELDQILKDVAVIDEKNPVRVFVQTRSNQAMPLSVVTSGTGFDVFSGQAGAITGTATDFGSATMSGNEMWVPFSEEFASQLGGKTLPAVTVTPNCPSVVLCVSQKTNTGFKVVGVSGSGPLTFDWMAMANAASIAVSAAGDSRSVVFDYMVLVKPKTNYGAGRFVQAPGPGYLKADQEPLAAKAANQGAANIWHWPADYEVYGYEPADFTPAGAVVEHGKYAGYFKGSDGKVYSPAEWSNLNTRVAVAEKPPTEEGKGGALPEKDSAISPASVVPAAAPAPGL
jgi:hypothetical protein